jgi:general secretion pathway protein I
MRSARGFTLLEVLVATVIMAIAVSGLLANLSTSLRNGARLTDYDRAAQVAKIRMNELLLDPHVARFQLLEGALDPKRTGWDKAGWRAQVTVFEAPPNPGPNTAVLDRVDLEIWWMIGDRRRSFRLEGFRRGLLRPEDVLRLQTQQPSQ